MQERGHKFIISHFLYFRTLLYFLLSSDKILKNICLVVSLENIREQILYLSSQREQRHLFFVNSRSLIHINALYLTQSKTQ